MKIIVSGSTGRVGKELIQLLSQGASSGQGVSRQRASEQGTSEQGASERHTSGPAVLQTAEAGPLNSISSGSSLASCGGFINRQGFSTDGKTYTLLNKAQAQADGVIDFSLPENIKNLAYFCAQNKLPLVSGTTGLGIEHFKCFDQLAQRVPVLWAPNMSLGIYFLHQVVQQLAVLGEDFQFTMDETHHVHKKDKPSGTALFLQQAVQKSTGQACPVKAHRQGEVFGEHRVQACSPSEQLVFEHKALNRAVFAHGALRAAHLLRHKAAGRYQLKDLFGGHARFACV